MIVSFVNGRVRIRDQRLKSASFAEELKTMAAGRPGVLSLEISPVVGSALIYYDPQKVSDEDLVAVNEYLGGLPDAEPASRADFSLAFKKRTAAKIVRQGLILTLTATVITGGLGWGRRHTCLGLALLGLTGLHVWQTTFRRRKRALKRLTPIPGQAK